MGKYMTLLETNLIVSREPFLVPSLSVYVIQLNLKVIHRRFLSSLSGFSLQKTLV